jgi:hypothetical protein
VKTRREEPSTEQPIAMDGPHVLPGESVPCRGPLGDACSGPATDNESGGRFLMRGGP